VFGILARKHFVGGGEGRRETEKEREEKNTLDEMYVTFWKIT